MKRNSHLAGGKALRARLLAGAIPVWLLCAGEAAAQAAPATSPLASSQEQKPAETPPAPGSVPTLVPGPVTGPVVPARALAEPPPQTVVQPSPPTAATRLNPTGRNIALTSPLREGAFILGDVDFVLGADDSVTVSTARLLALLKPVLESKRYAELEVKFAGLPQVSAATVTAAGYPLRYDPETIGLAIDIPADARTTRQIQLSDLDEELIGEVDKPASFAGYINFRSSLDYQWQGDGRGIQDPLVLIDSAIRYKGVVLENEGTVQLGGGSNGTSFRREGTRFVYDDIARLARITVGDLQPTGRGFSGAPQLAGASIVRSYSVLEPQRNVQPRGERTFTVARPSTVEAFINGQSVRQIRLQPGTYNVRDFPFAQGSNDVRLVVTDDAGGVNVIEFSLFFDRTLLAPGLTEFGLYAGVLAPFTGTSRAYHLSEPAASGYIRRGVSERLTAGVNFQLQRRGAVLGGEAVVATPLGTLGGDLAFSHVAGIGTGYAVNLGLVRTFGGRASSGRAFGLTFETRSKNFATPNDLVAANRFAFETGATYSQSLGEFQFVSFTGLYSKGRNGFEDQKSARLSYGYRLSQRLNLAAEGIYEDRQDARRNYGVRLTLTLRAGQRSSAVAEYDSRNNRGRIGYQTSRGDGVGAWAASGDVDYSSGSVGADASVSYIANRADLGISHTTVFDTSGRNVTDQRTSLRVGTAIAFADGKFALSRPIFDSFAMVAAHKSLDGKDVYVDPRNGHYSAKSGFFGPAVEPNVSSYSDRVFSFDVPDAPIGYDLGQGNFRVYPPYRSGYLITAGSDYSVTGIGTLHDQNGAPLSLLAGEAVEINHPATKVTVFTNRAGRFGVQGLRPGKWRITMPSQPPGSIDITVPEGSEGVVRLGDLTLGDAK